jgi:hypothetical protein
VCAWVANSHRVLQALLFGSASESELTIRDTVADGSFASDPQWMIRADQYIAAMRGRDYPPHRISKV